MLRSLALAALAFTALPLAAQPSRPATPREFNDEVKARILTRIDTVMARTAFVPGVDFSNWPTVREKHREPIAAARTEDAFAGALNQALGEYKVSHMAVITPRAAQAQRSNQQEGIGVMPRYTDDGIVLESIIPDSPADRAGLKPGDTILEVNGQKATSPANLAGPVGTELKMKVRGADGKEREVTVTRGTFRRIPALSLAWPKPDVAVIRVPSFERTYQGDRVRELMGEVNAKAKTLVIDLRNNPGGLVMNMLHFSGFLLPRESSLGMMLNRSMVNRFVAETGKRPDAYAEIYKWTDDRLRPFAQSQRFTGRIAVLINGGTGSAAEILSASLRDSAQARVFGTKSIGMVLAAIITPLGGGFNMIVPIQDYLTPSGQRLEGRGVVPDVTVAGPVLPPAMDQDPALQAALQWHSNAPR